MKRYNEAYDWGAFWKAMIILIVVMLLQMASGGAAYLALVPFILAAVVQRKPEMQVFWILLTITMTMGNSYFTPKGVAFFIGNRLVMGIFGIVGFMQLAGSKKSPVVLPLMGMFFYILYMLIPSMSGWCPIVSYLKIALFLTVYMAYFSVANSAVIHPSTDICRMRGMLLAMASFFIIGSVLTIPFPGVSQLTGIEYEEAIRSGHDVVSLFKGMTIHSQSLGPLIGALFTMLFADMCFNIRRFDRFYVLLLLLCPLLIYMSSSRAGMVTFIMGLLFVGWCLMRERRVSSRWKTKVMSALWLILILAAGVILAVPNMRDGVVRFALKYNRDATASDFTVAEAMKTRQGTMDEAMENFRKKPALGNGFQVSSGMQGFHADSFVSLLSAPVEKGVWITAVLEEGGVVGFVILCLFLLNCGLKLLRRRSRVALSMMFILIVSNMAEMTMFSMTATGGFIWALVFIASAFDGVNLRNQRTHAWQSPYCGVGR